MNNPTPSSPRVYLAGPIRGLSYVGAVNWRVEAADVLSHSGIQAFSPMRGKSHLIGQRNLNASDDTHPLSGPRGLTTRDRMDCMRADVILMNLLGADEISIGTMIEVGWADAARIPIVLVMEDEGAHRHPMLNEIVGFHVETLSEGISIVRSLVLP